MQTHSPFPFHWCSPHPVIILQGTHTIGCTSLEPHMLSPGSFWTTPRSRLLQLHCFDLWFFKLFARNANNASYWFMKMAKINDEQQEKTKSGRKKWRKCKCCIGEASSMNYRHFLILLGSIENVPGLKNLLCLFSPLFGSILWCCHS